MSYFNQVKEFTKSEKYNESLTGRLHREYDLIYSRAWLDSVSGEDITGLQKLPPKKQWMEMQRQQRRNQRNGRGGGGQVRNVNRNRGNVPNPRAGVVNTLGIRQHIRQRLVYTGTNTLTTSATGGYAFVTTPLNSAYNGGVNPALGYAKWMQFYSKCFVLGTTARVKFGKFNVSGDLSLLNVGITVSTNVNTFTNSGNAISNGRCSWAILGINPDQCTLTQRLNVAQFFEKPYILDDPQLFSTSNADPTQMIFMHI